jgi:hypothetical protein
MLVQLQDLDIIVRTHIMILFDSFRSTHEIFRLETLLMARFIWMLRRPVIEICHTISQNLKLFQAFQEEKLYISIKMSFYTYIYKLFNSDCHL